MIFTFAIAYAYSSIPETFELESLIILRSRRLSTLLVISGVELAAIQLAQY